MCLNKARFLAKSNKYVADQNYCVNQGQKYIDIFVCLLITCTNFKVSILTRCVHAFKDVQRLESKPLISNLEAANLPKSNILVYAKKSTGMR